VIAEALDVVECRLLRRRRLIQETEVADWAAWVDRSRTGFTALTRAAAFTGLGSVGAAA